MSHFVALILSLYGFAALACATHRQQRDLFGRVLSSVMTRMLRVSGVAALLGALCGLLAWHGFGPGLVMFSGHTSLAAGMVVVGLIGLVRIRGRHLRHR